MLVKQHTFRPSKVDANGSWNTFSRVRGPCFRCANATPQLLPLACARCLSFFGTWTPLSTAKSFLTTTALVDALHLRVHCRIIGAMVGGLSGTAWPAFSECLLLVNHDIRDIHENLHDIAGYRSQVSLNGLPLQLSVEEAALALQKGTQLTQSCRPNSSSCAQQHLLMGATIQLPLHTGVELVWL